METGHSPRTRERARWKLTLPRTAGDVGAPRVIQRAEGVLRHGSSSRERWIVERATICDGHRGERRAQQGALAIEEFLRIRHGRESSSHAQAMSINLEIRGRGGVDGGVRGENVLAVKERPRSAVTNNHGSNPNVSPARGSNGSVSSAPADLLAVVRT